MPVDFGLLQPAQPVSAFFQGQQDVRQQADQNALRQIQMQRLAAQQADFLAQQQEREAQAAERRRATAAQNALAAYSQSGQPMTPEALARFGAPGLALSKSLREERAGLIEQELKVLDYASRRLAAATPETYGAIRADLNRINPQFGASLPQEFNPEQVMALARQGMSLKDQIESATKETVVPPGATVVRGGKAIYTAPAAEKPYEPTEVEKLTNALKAAPPGSPEAQALQARIRILTTREPKEGPAPTITQIQNPNDPTQMLTIDARRYAGGGIGSPGVVGASGKTPKAEADRLKQEQGASQAQDILDSIKTAYAELDRMRAVPSEQRGVVSNVLSGIAATGVGQTAGRLAGTKEQTQRDIIASSRNQLLSALKNATGMSAQQLNSNVELRTWLDSLSDPSRSIQANQAILENVEKFITSGGKYSAKKGGGELKFAPNIAPAATQSGATVSNW